MSKLFIYLLIFSHWVLLLNCRCLWCNKNQCGRPYWTCQSEEACPPPSQLYVWQCLTFRCKNVIRWVAFPPHSSRLPLSTMSLSHTVCTSLYTLQLHPCWFSRCPPVSFHLPKTCLEGNWVTINCLQFAKHSESPGKKMICSAEMFKLSNVNFLYKSKIRYGNWLYTRCPEWM